MFNVTAMCVHVLSDTFQTKGQNGISNKLLVIFAREYFLQYSIMI